MSVNAVESSTSYGVKLGNVPILLIFSVGVLLGGCGEKHGGAPATPTGDDGRLRVHAVNYPLAYFAERIGGERVRVEFPVPGGIDPAFWVPDTEAVLGFQDADLVLLNGAGYAAWVDRVTLPTNGLVNTSIGFLGALIPIEDATVHTHGPTGEHSHGQTAFTTWLDPRLALEQAGVIRQRLAALRPDAALLFDQGFAALETDLAGLDAPLAATAAAIGDRRLLGSHPVYQYLAQRYGLNLRSVHFEPDELPDDRGWRDLRALLGEHPAEWMLWESEPLPETIARLRELGIESIVYDPCGNRPGSGDFLSVMQDNAAHLARIAE